MNNISWRDAERIFRTEGPFSHINSSHIEDAYIFDNDEERALALLYMALAADETGVVILAYAIMTNHFHFIVKGNNEEAFFSSFKRRMALYLSRHGRPKLLDDMTCKVTAITDLNHFYAELSYVIRNPFVVDPNVNLLSYIWCSGYLYFNNLVKFIPLRKASDLSYRERRRILKSDLCELPEWVMINDGYISPLCFVDYNLVERLFMTPRNFLWHCLRNVEAQIETALKENETPVLSDDEVYRLIKTKLEDDYKTASYKLLPASQQKDFLNYLKYKLYLSNGQIARTLRLRQNEVDACFPLTAKKP